MNHQSFHDAWWLVGHFLLIPVWNVNYQLIVWWNCLTFLQVFLSFPHFLRLISFSNALNFFFPNCSPKYSLFALFDGEIFITHCIPTFFISVILCVQLEFNRFLRHPLCGKRKQKKKKRSTWATAAALLLVHIATSLNFLCILLLLYSEVRAGVLVCSFYFTSFSALSLPLPSDSECPRLHEHMLFFTSYLYYYSQVLCCLKNALISSFSPFSCTSVKTLLLEFKLLREEKPD